MFKLADYLQLAGPYDERMDSENLLKRFKQKYGKEHKASHKKDPLDDMNTSAEEKIKMMDPIKKGLLKILKEEHFEGKYGKSSWQYKFEACFGGYKKPFLVNAVNAMNKHYGDLYIYPTFMSAGR
jgi:hypothetical protein